jgi:hypothetical protein
MMKRWLKIECAVLLGLLVCVSPVDAQQTAIHSVPIGKGPGQSGFNSVGPCANGSILAFTGVSSNPTCWTLYQLALLQGPPKVQGFSSIRTILTPDADTSLILVELVGGGGAGQGSVSANPKVPFTYATYGRIGTPSAFGTTDYTATITNASPGVVTATGSNAVCNDPVYFSTTGTLPSPLVADTVYYVQCGNDSYPAPTANTFALSLVQYGVPLTCAVYAPFCQTPIDTTTSGSGVHTLHQYTRVAQSGNGGGIIGDQSVPGNAVRCDFTATWPAGYQQGHNFTGGVGSNVYGVNVWGSIGGGTFFGPGSAATTGLNGLGTGGGAGAPTSTGPEGGGGAGGGTCRFWFRPAPATTYPILCGTGGVAGTADSSAVTIATGSPGTVTLNDHPYGPNSIVQFTGTLPTGLSLATNYYVYGPSITTNTFQVSATPNGTRINMGGSPANVVVNSGSAGSAGGNGACIITQFKG